jgi:hypothetical protein
MIYPGHLSHMRLMGYGFLLGKPASEPVLPLLEPKILTAIWQ